MKSEREHGHWYGWQDRTRAPASVAKRTQQAAPADGHAGHHERGDGGKHQATEGTVGAVDGLEGEERDEDAGEAREQGVGEDCADPGEQLGDERADAGDAGDEQGEAERGVDDGDDGPEVRPQGARRKSREADLVNAVALHGGEAELGDEDDGGHDVGPGDQDGGRGGRLAGADGGGRQAQHARPDRRADDEAHRRPEALLPPAGSFSVGLDGGRLEGAIADAAGAAPPPPLTPWRRKWEW